MYSIEYLLYGLPYGLIDWLSLRDCVCLCVRKVFTHPSSPSRSPSPSSPFPNGRRHTLKPISDAHYIHFLRPLLTPVFSPPPPSAPRRTLLGTVLPSPNRTARLPPSPAPGFSMSRHASCLYVRSELHTRVKKLFNWRVQRQWVKGVHFVKMETVSGLNRVVQFGPLNGVECFFEKFSDVFSEIKSAAISPLGILLVQNW